MSNYIPPEQIALEWLVEQVEEGIEFPEALYRTSKRFSFSHESLQEAYDALPTPAQIHSAFRLMEEMGGSFAAKLAAAWFVADSTNKLKIEATWGDMLKKYLPS